MKRFDLSIGNRSHPDQFPKARGMAKSGGEGTAPKWFDVTVLEKESPLPARRLLLEETKRRQNYTGGSHEAEGSLLLMTGTKKNKK